MISPPKSRAEAEKLIYGGSSISGSKAPFDPKQCAYEVCVNEGRWTSFHQCCRKPGFGPDKIFCKFHDPAAIKLRDKKRNEKWNQKQRAERPKWYAYEMLALLKESQSMAIDGGSWRKRRDALIKQIEKD